MLRIRFKVGLFDNEISDVDKVFDACVQKEWLNTDFAKKVIKDIDNTVHVKDMYLESPFYGAMPPQYLSTGCKNVLLMKFYPKQMIFYGTKCGDNCVPYILEIAKEKDIDLHLMHMMYFPEKDQGFEAYVVETDKMIYSYSEFVMEYGEYYYRKQR